MEALRSVLNYPSTPSADEEAGILSGIGEVTRLSYATRLKCFVACFLIGILFSIVGSIVLFFGLKRGLPAFAVLYTLGNIVSIASTMFLVGPMKQIKNIFATTRLIASLIVLLSFVLTLVAAFAIKSAPLALVMVFIQSLAMTWYSISYIPFARDFVKTIFSSCF